jgi:hypothetical protein
MRVLPCSITGLAVVILSAGSALGANSVDGRYDATINLNGTVIPFRLDISGEGNMLTGTLYNGDDKETTTDASLVNGAINLNFEHYLTKIVATPKDGKLEGKVFGRFERDTYISAIPFEATPHVEPAAVQGNVPAIGGVWEIEYESAKGEKA